MDTLEKDSEVTFEVLNGKGIISLNRPQKFNAITVEMAQTIRHKLINWEYSKGEHKVNFVVIRASGGVAFCAGGDIRIFTESEEKQRTYFLEAYPLVTKIKTYNRPYIALTNGLTFGGGVGLSLNAKYQVATEKTQFAMPEVQIGWFPDVGACSRLARLSRNFGTFVALTGHRLGAEELFSLGLFTHLCRSVDLVQLEEELLAPDCVTSVDIVKVLDKYHSKYPRTFEPTERLEELMVKVERCFTTDTVEQIISNLDKDGSSWALETKEKMLKMSPTSLKITKRLLDLQESFQGDFKQCIIAEFRLMLNLVRSSHADMVEGCNAVLTRKDQKPRWQPATLEQVSHEEVLRCFSVLPIDDELHIDDYL